MSEAISKNETSKSSMSLTPVEITFPAASTLSDALISELITYTKFNGMLLGYISIIATIYLLSKVTF